jgi:hypothetical protein
MDYFDLMQEERMWPTTYEEEDTRDLYWADDDDDEDEFQEYA